MQVIYGILAMSIVALLSLTLNRSISGADQRKIVNELTTQLSGVGFDVLENIGSLPFDSKTDTNKTVIRPPVSDPSQLTSKGSFGGCADYDSCEDIDDFDGMTAYRTDGLFDYSVTIAVNYVVENTPSQSSGAPTYAKEVVLTMTNPHMKLGNQPLTVQMSRVFTYQKVTNP